MRQFTNRNNQIQQAQPINQPITCNYCGRMGHGFNECRTRIYHSRRPNQSNQSVQPNSFKNHRKLKCFKCNRFGHIASECRSKNIMSVEVQDNPQNKSSTDSSSVYRILMLHEVGPDISINPTIDLKHNAL